MPFRLPTIFVGHGSPENALADNPYAHALARLAEDIPRPEAVLVVSAHYLREGVLVTSSPQPATIHDFYGFSEVLSEIEYAAPGAPELAAEIARLLGGETDPEWGLDHAAWAVLRHMWPDASVPVAELSLDPRVSTTKHYQLGRRLAELPSRGVLVLGSGNIVHNLNAAIPQPRAPAYQWALDFDAAVARALEARDDDALLSYRNLPGSSQSVPALDHYLPLLYAAAAAGEDAPATSFYEGIEMGSVSMRCVRFG